MRGREVLAIPVSELDCGLFDASDLDAVSVGEQLDVVAVDELQVTLFVDVAAQKDMLFVLDD
ncbi:MAG: hypothetical protein AAF721_19180 [Myxococcota bacterium]